MKKKVLVWFMTVIMSLSLCLGLVACNTTPPSLTKLGKVTVELNGDMATWGEVANASRYAYQINDDEVVETTLRATELEDGDTIKVKAIGDGVKYSDGDFSATKTFNASSLPALAKVAVSVNEDTGVASWDAVANAVGYAYQIDGGDLVKTSARAVVLQSGQTIKVKAIADGKRYKDGEFSLVASAPVKVPFKDIVVPFDAEEGETVTLSDISLTAGFSWKTPTEVVASSGYYSATYQGKNCQIYVDLMIKATALPPIPVVIVPNYTTVVVQAEKNEGDTLLLSNITDLPEGFAWKDGNEQVTASKLYEATYTEGGQTVDAQVYIDLTINATPVEPTPEQPDVTTPAYTTVVVQAEKDEGDTLLLSDITDLPEGFAWKDGNEQVTASRLYDATYTKDGDAVEAKIYIDLTINATSVQPTPEQPAVPYDRIVVSAVVNEGGVVYLNTISLPEGFTWHTPGAYITESGDCAAYYNGIFATVYVDVKVLPAEPPTPTKLGDVTLHQDGNMVTWAVVTGAVRYAYQIGDGEVVETTLRAVQLKDGESIVVKAIGDGVNYSDGDYCAPVSYTAPPVVAPTKLGNVTLTLKGHTASWAAVANASRYAYQINGGEVVETTLRTLTLDAGDTIKVKAIGDGVNYADGDYCAEVKHNTIYDKEIFDEAVVTLNGLEPLTNLGRTPTVQDVPATASFSPSSITSGVNTLSAGAVIDGYVKAQGNSAIHLTYFKEATLTIPMVRNGQTLSKEKLQLFSKLRLSVFYSGDYLWNDSVKQLAASIKFANKTYTPDDFVPGWNVLEVTVAEFLASKTYDGTISVKVTRPQQGTYTINFDNLQGVYPEKLNLGNVMVFGDSYSTYQGYIHDPRFFYYADNPVSQTDVNDVSQTWWGQVIANTDSNLIMNDAISGSTVSATTYTAKWDASPQDCFVERIDRLIANNYFKQNQVDTVFMFGGTNDSWGGNALGSAKYSNWTKSDLEQVLPAYCYFISKILENSTTATIVVVLNTYKNLNDPIIPSYRAEARDYQTAIINAVKGFSQYGSRIQIVALSDKEHNAPDTSIGMHPTKAGMAAIKDQILNALYERKHLPMSKWTPIGNVSAGGTTEVVLNNFASAVETSYLGTATATRDTTHTADGNGSWAVSSTKAGELSYVICYMTSSLSTYDALKLVVYANDAAVGMKLYVDREKTMLIGTLAYGKNEFIIPKNNMMIFSDAWGNKHFDVCFQASSTSAIVAFDSLSGLIYN